jgi:hypothetical protein
MYLVAYFLLYFLLFYLLYGEVKGPGKCGGAQIANSRNKHNIRLPIWEQ